MPDPCFGRPIDYTGYTMHTIKTSSGFPEGDFTVHVAGDLAPVATVDHDLTDYDEEMDELEVMGWSAGVTCPCGHFAWYHSSWGETRCGACDRRIDIHVSAYAPSVTSITTDPMLTHPRTITAHPDDMAERIELVEEVNTLRERNDTLLDIIRELRDRVKGMQG